MKLIGETDGGNTPQMGDKWIIDRLKAAIGEEMANKIRMEMISNPDNVGTVLVTASANGIENIERGFNNYKGFDISEMRDYQNIKIFRFEVINDASKKIKRVYVKELNQ